jgi:hypothetical protein
MDKHPWWTTFILPSVLGAALQACNPTKPEVLVREMWAQSYPILALADAFDVVATQLSNPMQSWMQSTNDMLRCSDRLPAHRSVPAKPWRETHHGSPSRSAHRIWTPPTSSRWLLQSTALFMDKRPRVLSRSRSERILPTSFVIYKPGRLCWGGIADMSSLDTKATNLRTGALDGYVISLPRATAC